jgi:trehalose-6-phosphate synthase
MVSFFNLVQLFIRYVGYGNAAGYLFTKGVTAPPTEKCTNKLFSIGDDVDPITGFVKDAPKEDPWEGMDEDEKARESEKLFVLFDRLNKNGIIKTVPKKE